MNNLNKYSNSGLNNLFKSFLKVQNNMITIINSVWSEESEFYYNSEYFLNLWSKSNENLLTFYTKLDNDQKNKFINYIINQSDY